MQKKTDPDLSGGKRFKRTSQRLAILDYLEGNTEHPSADQIYRAVSKHHRSLSFATVYNTLHMLTKSGMLRELNIDPERKRYDPNTTRHHHLICVQCGRISDISEGITVELPEHLARGITLLGSHVVFYSRCESCSNTKQRVD